MGEQVAIKNGVTHELNQQKAPENIGGPAETPLVTVITPVKNAGKYLEGCIQSVLSQSYTNIEHLFIDGVSTDGTLEMLAQYQAKYPGRIRFTSEPDKNIVEAWIKGMRKARGDILGWLGTDDIYEPKAIQTVVDFFQNNRDAYFVFGGCNYIDENGGIIRNIVTKDFNLKDAINDACYIPCPSAFYKREVIETVDPGGMEELDSEVEYWIRIGEKYKIYRVENTLSSFRLHNAKNKSNKSELLDFARTSYLIGRRHGAGIFSPCARRYYFAVATRPLQPILDPIFHYLSTGNADKNSFMVKVTRPLHAPMVFMYHMVTGSKPLGKKK